jgi:hypothetical protein
MKMVFIPDGKKYSFPGQCANCMGLITTTNQMELSKELHTSEDRILERKIITHTYTIKRKMRIPYCSSCSEHGQQLRKAVGSVNLIAAILGVISGITVAILIYIDIGDLDWVRLIFFFGATGLLVFGVLHVVLRSLLLFKYRDIWKAGSSTGTLGVQGEIIAEIEHGKPTVEGLKLWFSNNEYAQIFMEANNLLESK